MQKSFVFDLNKCTGCQACQIACSIENELDPEINWRQIETFNPDHYPHIPQFHLSLACNHCVDPPCMKYCPANAYAKDPQTGAVTINHKRCIGCKYCSWVCPYDAPKFNHANGIMEKCTFCDHRLQEGLNPACVSLCPTDALQIADEFEENQQNGKIAGFPQSEIKPAIKFRPLREQHQVPEYTVVHSTSLLDKFSQIFKNNRDSKISLKSEWTLLVFTITAALLVGWFAASLLTTISIPPILFLGIGVAGMGLSTLHLSKKLRGFRAIYNWRHSWLSREVLCYSGFIILAGLHFFLSPFNPYWGWLAVLSGLLALLSMDMVYKVIPRTESNGTHSANAMLSGIFIFTLFYQQFLIFGLIALVKGLLYGFRKMSMRKQEKDTRPVLTVLRIGIGILVPAVLWWMGPAELYWVSVGCVILGEIIDRSEFYIDMDIITPRKQMFFDFKAALKNRSLHQKEGTTYAATN